MWDWLDHAGYTADLPRLRARNPALTDLEHYLTRHGWSAGAELTVQQQPR
jgi:hypothetical protein